MKRSDIQVCPYCKKRVTLKIEDRAGTKVKACPKCGWGVKVIWGN